MNAISGFLAADHRKCDEQFFEAEAAAQAGDWPKADRRFQTFDAAMRHHFAMEEQILFPEFERRTGNDVGPTRMMRIEHEQMRDLLEAMAGAINRQDQDTFAGLAETLLVLMQQHNLKEEQILYPMCDRVLTDVASDLVSRMSSLDGENGKP